MTEWKDPQQRAEEEDRQRGYPALAVDGGADSREKLEADLEKLRVEWKYYDGNFMRVYSYVAASKITALLDRQAAITRAECDKPNWNYCETCELQAELDDWRGAAEHLDSVNDGLRDKVAELAADRDRLLEQLNRVWLKDADGNPLHIGETRYGEDGTEWRVTGFRWGSSHPVQGVDKEGRRRDLKASWLSSERPDSLGSLLEDVRRGAMAYPRDRITGYLEDNHSIGEAVLLDVRDRIEKLAGGSE